MVNLRFVLNRIFVGVSGGLDSVVLLHILCAQESPEKITVLHVNHHLQKDADSWSKFVAKIAAEYGCNVEICRVKSEAFVGENIEAEARKQRYAFFESHLQDEQDYLFLAHHQQDQVETFFLNLQRGAGLAGLSAMPGLRPFGKGYLARPLLGYSRQDLELYAKTHKLQWVEDPSNQDVSLNRNFLRQQVLPMLRERWPHFDDHVADAVGHLQEARTALESYLQEDLLKLGNPLDLKVWQSLPESRHKLLLQLWIKEQSGKILSDKQLEVIIKEVIGAANDRAPLFEIPGLKIYRQKKKLILETKSK